MIIYFCTCVLIHDEDHNFIGVIITLSMDILH